MGGSSTRLCAPLPLVCHFHQQLITHRAQLAPMRMRTALLSSHQLFISHRSPTLAHEAHHTFAFLHQLHISYRSPTLAHETHRTFAFLHQLHISHRSPTLAHEAHRTFAFVHQLHISHCSTRLHVNAQTSRFTLAKKGFVARGQTGSWDSGFTYVTGLAGYNLTDTEPLYGVYMGGTGGLPGAGPISIGVFDLTAESVVA